MVDEPKTTAELLASFADNVTGDITPQDLRNFVVTVMGGFGNLGTHDGVTPQININQTYQKLTGWLTEGAADGVTLSANDSRITIDFPGTYMVAFGISFNGANNTSYKFTLFVDQVEATPNALSTEARLDSASSIVDAGGITFLEFTGGEQLEMFVKADSGTTTIDPFEMDFVVSRRG